MKPGYQVAVMEKGCPLLKLYDAATLDYVDCLRGHTGEVLLRAHPTTLHHYPHCTRW